MKILLVSLLIVFIQGCTKNSAPESNQPLSGEDLVSRGKQIYNLNCIACHNSDPTKDGASGPAVAFSTKELLEARIMKASYPESYKPKRDSKLMVALPHLEKEIPAIEAFLNKK